MLRRRDALAMRCRGHCADTPVSMPRTITFCLADLRCDRTTNRWPSYDRRTRPQAAVTLLLGMSKPEGIYMSVDFRVSDSKTRECLDYAVVKFLTVQYPPDEGGPTAVFAYTGLADTHRRLATRDPAGRYAAAIRRIDAAST